VEERPVTKSSTVWDVSAVAATSGENVDTRWPLDSYFSYYNSTSYYRQLWTWLEKIKQISKDIN